MKPKELRIDSLKISDVNGASMYSDFPGIVNHLFLTYFNT